ncbi:MAG: AIM24 family protein [Thermoplasmata archaeon]
MKTDFVGDITPIVLVKLEQYEKIYLDNDIMLYKDPSVNVERKVTTNIGNRLRMDRFGFPHELYFAVFEGPGYVAISHDRPGECRPVTLQPNQGVYVRWGNLLFATDSVTYAPYIQTLKRYYNRIFVVGFENFMGPGEIYVQSFGNVFQFNLQPNEMITVSVNSLLMFDDTVKFDFATYLVPPPTQIGLQQEAYQNPGQATYVPLIPGKMDSIHVLLNVYGPGRVLVHSGR